MGLLTAGVGALSSLLGGGSPAPATLSIQTSDGSIKSSITFAVNPSSITLKKTSSFKKAAPAPQGGTQGGGGALKKVQAPATQPQGAQPATLTVTGFLDATQTSSSDIMDDLSALWACTLLPTASGGSAPTPPIVTLTWGTWTWIDCFMTSFSAKLTMFRSDGTPVRAQIDLSLTEYVAPQQGQNPTSGAFGSRETHTVVAGDSLASVSYKAYGRADYWRAIAEVNGIDDPLRVRPGTSLLIPPADVAREMK